MIHNYNNLPNLVNNGQVITREIINEKFIETFMFNQSRTNQENISNIYLLEDSILDEVSITQEYDQSIKLYKQPIPTLTDDYNINSIQELKNNQLNERYKIYKIDESYIYFQQPNETQDLIAQIENQDLSVIIYKVKRGYYDTNIYPNITIESDYSFVDNNFMYFGVYTGSSIIKLYSINITNLGQYLQENNLRFSNILSEITNIINEYEIPNVVTYYGKYDLSINNIISIDDLTITIYSYTNINTLNEGSQIYFYVNRYNGLYIIIDDYISNVTHIHQEDFTNLLKYDNTTYIVKGILYVETDEINTEVLIEDKENITITGLGNQTSIIAFPASNTTGFKIVDSNNIIFKDFKQMGYVSSTSSNLLSFDWSVSSESGWDWFNVYINGSQVLNLSGVDSDTYSQNIFGDLTIKFEYIKDSSYQENDDQGYIRNLNIGMLTNLEQEDLSGWTLTGSQQPQLVDIQGESWLMFDNITDSQFCQMERTFTASEYQGGELFLNLIYISQSVNTSKLTDKIYIQNVNSELIKHIIQFDTQNIHQNNPPEIIINNQKIYGDIEYITDQEFQVFPIKPSVRMDLSKQSFTDLQIGDGSQQVIDWDQNQDLLNITSTNPSRFKIRFNNNSNTINFNPDNFQEPIHTHDMSDITSGILSIASGGTNNSIMNTINQYIAYDGTSLYTGNTIEEFGDQIESQLNIEVKDEFDTTQFIIGGSNTDLQIQSQNQNLGLNFNQQQNKILFNLMVPVKSVNTLTGDIVFDYTDFSQSQEIHSHTGYFEIVGDTITPTVDTIKQLRINTSDSKVLFQLDTINKEMSFRLSPESFLDLVKCSNQRLKIFGLNIMDNQTTVVFSQQE